MSSVTAIGALGQQWRNKETLFAKKHHGLQIWPHGLHCATPTDGHVHIHHFAMDSRLNNRFPQNGFEVHFLSFGVCVRGVIQSAATYICKPHYIKKAVQTMDPTNTHYKCIHSSLVCATIQDIRRCVCRK